MAAETTLGRLVWFNVDQGVEVEHITFCQKLLMAGVGTAMPNAPKTSDVFKRACTRALIALGSGDYKIIPSGTDNYSVWRNIVHVGETVAVVKFNKTTEEVSVDEADDTDPNVGFLCGQITDYCASHSTMLTDYSVREHIRGVVEKEFQAVRVKQGLYFVLDRFDDQMDALQAAVNDLGGDPIHMWSVNVEWNDEQSDMVTTAVIGTLMADASDLRSELKTIENADKSISKNRFSDLDAEYNRLRDQYGLFKTVVTGEIAVVEEVLSLAAHDLMTVMGRIRV